MLFISSGQSIDGIENGPIPDPWDVDVGVPTKFLDHKITTEIPHSAYVKQCHTCHGRKKVTCSSCGGFGTESCSSCSGSGKDSDDNSCTSCGGSGSRYCWVCSGSGKVKCGTCDGHGDLKHYRLLIVTWKNHINDYVSNSDNLPGDLVTQVEGKDLFCEQGIQVIPMTMALDNEINIASSSLIREHSVSFPSEQILAQRHKLRAVPITRAKYIWRSKTGEFYVYGYENKVYFERYPQQCCCCTCC
ncbi:uncharacterized protein CDAR_197461 [Caerostris darwini]|uniref:Uncharacterized protein n=1 Tax=Caerostris darwini TaxID=1538125 RepID=A0AAV4UU89_9ARAC|nr:uncharacterized protein CDAR_197461 [Caerostris darwini]